MFRQDYTCPDLLSIQRPMTYPYGAVTHIARLSRRFRFSWTLALPDPRSLSPLLTESR